LENIESIIWLFADDCVICRKIMDSSDVDKILTDLNTCRLQDWTMENEMKINPGYSVTVSCTKARVKERIRYNAGGLLIPEASSFKYLGVIICSDLNWADHVNYTLRKNWKALHFIMRVPKKGKYNGVCSAYTALVRPILEHRAVCWDPHSEGQVSAENWVHKRPAKFANNINESSLETWHNVD
jgi:hypothetical protein